MSYLHGLQNTVFNLTLLASTFLGSHCQICIEDHPAETLVALPQITLLVSLLILPPGNLTLDISPLAFDPVFWISKSRLEGFASYAIATKSGGALVLFEKWVCQRGEEGLLHSRIQIKSTHHLHHLAHYTVLGVCTLLCRRSFKQLQSKHV
ncbi:hypothetical protein LIER_19602 [Lithospermum erythrorhizon]|uniref:Uncharacterized protein n=1 Tax=Lithospermum erythrorhizon TaxID=34254 RepID=A0AAV3QNX2_LITER